MRLLALAPTGFFADYGCHVRIRGHLAALQARGHNIRLVTYPSGRDVEGLRTLRPALWPRGRTLPVGSSRRKLLLDTLLIPTALRAALHFPGGKPQLIHAFLHEGALLGAALARLLRVPLVFDFQGSLTAEMLDHRFIRPASPWLPPLQRLEQAIDHQPHAIFASSHHAVTRLRQAGVPAAHIHTLPDSVDPERFRPRAELDPARLTALRAALTLPADRPVVAYLGLLAPYQGTDLLLQAWQTLSRQPRPPHLLLMGFPDVAHYTERARQLGVAQHVTFTGAVAYEDAPFYLALGDAAVAPKLSATEGSGKLLPYMAAALPVAAFDTPVQREYLGDWGFYAAPGDAAGLAHAITRALSEQHRARQAAQALRARVVSAYTWQHAAQALEAVYATLLA